MTLPAPTVEDGQRSLDLPIFLHRLIPQWGHPDWMAAERWRTTVKNQPIAMVCRETLIQNILSLDWKIQPRDPEQKDELKEEIKYYTRFLENTGEVEFSNHVEWVAQDLLDLPFGGGAEIGREGDSADGKALWIEPLDAGTLFPTNNMDFPVGQLVPEASQFPVFFPKHAIDRIYGSPRTEIKRKGWGMAPPEKIYLALNMLFRGDLYYANLLLDTPEAGVLYLGNISKNSAEAWLKSYKGLMYGIDPLKVPIVYETDQKPAYIPFGRSPNELILDKQTTKYASIICAGYGMSLSDIGVQATTSGGETLAGSIRQERKTRRSGQAMLKKKLEAYFNYIIDPNISESKVKFTWIDYDDEVNVARGRARLASATAGAQWIKDGVFTPDELRQQAVADGLITVSVPEKIPEDEIPDWVKNQGQGFGSNNNNNGSDPAERPNEMGRPVPVSAGGQGE